MDYRFLPKITFYQKNKVVPVQTLFCPVRSNMLSTFTFYTLLPAAPHRILALAIGFRLSVAHDSTLGLFFAVFRPSIETLISTNPFESNLTNLEGSAYIFVTAMKSFS